MAQFLTITATTVISAGNTAVNTYHYSADGGVAVFGLSDSAVEAQANAAITQLGIFYTSLTTKGLLYAWTIGQVVTWHKTGDDTKFVNAAPQTTINGTGTQVANQLCGVISWKTGVAGRSNRGRNYYGPLAATGVSTTSMSSLWIAGANAAAAALIAAPTSSHLVPCVYSPTNDVTRKITQGVTSSNIRTMRSRAA